MSQVRVLPPASRNPCSAARACFVLPLGPLACTSTSSSAPRHPALSLDSVSSARAHPAPVRAEDGAGRRRRRPRLPARLARADAAAPGHRTGSNLPGASRERSSCPADRGYPAVSRPQNRRYADVHPARWRCAPAAADARESLLWARDNEVPIAVRSGGHNYAGYSTTDGLVIDFGRMRRVEVTIPSAASRRRARAPQHGRLRRPSAARRGDLRRALPDGGDRRPGARRRHRVQLPQARADLRSPRRGGGRSPPPGRS